VVKVKKETLKEFVAAIRTFAAAVVFIGFIALNIVIWYPVLSDLPEKIKIGNRLLPRAVFGYSLVVQTFLVAVIAFWLIWPKEKGG